jgi:DNA-binding transcriptional regulator YhcF (GntR family)
MANSTNKRPRVFGGHSSTRTPDRTRTSRISERIVARIKRQIAEGRLTAGTKLPPEREMARRHKVSRVTVREAYRSLEQLGILRISRGAGGGAVIAGAVPAGRQDLSRMLVLINELADMASHALVSSEAWGPAAKPGQSIDVFAGSAGRARSSSARWKPVFAAGTPA